MAIVTRQENGSPLTWNQMDENLTYLEGSVDSLNVAVSVLQETVLSLSFDTERVELTSSDILQLGARPATLLPSPGEDSYYLIDSIIVEYEYKTTAYVIPTSPTIYLDGCFDSYIDKALVTANTNTVCVISGNLRNTITVGSGSGSVKIITNKDVLNSSLIVGTTNGDNPTTGDGLLRFIIKYKRMRFGG